MRGLGMYVAVPGTEETYAWYQMDNEALPDHHSNILF